MRILAWLYRWVGWRAARLLVYPVVGYFFLTDREGRKASLDYLGRVKAAGRAGPEFEPGLRLVFRHYLEFGLSILDRLGFWLAGADEIACNVKGREVLEKIVKDGRGAVVLGSHVGSFDAMRLAASRESPIDIKILMYTQHAARINEMFRRMGAISGTPTTIGVISAEAGSFSHVFEVKRAIERGEVVAILGDRTHPNESDRVVEVDFLGGRAYLPQGPLLLAATLGCPVVLMAGLRSGDRDYEIHVEQFADPLAIPRRERASQLQFYAQAYANWLEGLCIATPLQWFNFYDFWAFNSAASREKDDH
jgi:predicted LPLAT superfamily acyltransferase